MWYVMMPALPVEVLSVPEAPFEGLTRNSITLFERLSLGSRFVVGSKW